MTSIAVMCGLTIALAILMLIAEATIANYGDVRISINDKRELTTQGGRSLLSTLKDEKIFIPSACGGRGSCGLCKVRIVEGGGEPLATETPWLDEEELKNDVRLSCQVRVKSDLKIAIPDELFDVTQYEARVAGLEDLTHDIKGVRLKIINPPQLQFIAGQFIQFEVPAYELTDEPVYRAYSIASSPSSAGEIDLEIRYVPNGICTTYVHQHLKVEDTVTINGPYGEFYLRDTDRDIIFIAGGSGMAPIRSILLDMAAQDNPRKATYFFGARSKRDLFLLDEMRALEEQLPAFQFIPSLSQPEPDDTWEGETGLITTIVEKHLSAGADMEAYLCGSPLMIDACVEGLKAKGIPEDRIYYDKFA